MEDSALVLSNKSFMLTEERNLMMQFRVGCFVLASVLLLMNHSAIAFAQEADDTEITLRVVTPKEYEAEIKKHKGKVVLVDFWATWCIPCLKNFHHSVEWQKKYAPNGLVVISVSMDDDDAETKQQALEFLKKQKAANITNLQSSLGGEEEAMKAFGITGGAIPFYKIYDKTGKLTQTFGTDPDNPPGPEDVEAAVKRALGI